MKTANEVFTNMMSDLGFEVDPKDLPGPDTPLPATNATLHILKREEGYGTPDRKFFMLCGVSFMSGEPGGEHKYFFRDETHWHKHINCERCRKLLEQ